MSKDNFQKVVANSMESMSDCAQHIGEGLREEFLSWNLFGQGKQGLIDDSKKLLQDMQSKGLIEGKLPSFVLSDISDNVGRFNDGEITSVKSKEYGTLMIGQPGHMAMMQINKVGGKVIDYSDSNNDAIIIEPRDGGYLMLDEKQNTFTIVNAKGERTVEVLSRDAKKAKEIKAKMDRLFDSVDFDIDWTSGSSFEATVW